jgi:nitrate/nitrite transporter NarK
MTLDSGNTETMGVSSSCVNFGGQVAGFFAPIIMGKLIDMSGGAYTSAFALLIFGAIAATLVALTLPKNKPANIAKTM